MNDFLINNNNKSNSNGINNNNNQAEKKFNHDDASKINNNNINNTHSSDDNSDEEDINDFKHLISQQATSGDGNNNNNIVSNDRPDPASMINTADYDLHVKDVGTIDIAAARELPVRDAKTRENMNHSLKWLLDKNSYDMAKLKFRDANGTPHARMSHDYVMKLERFGVIRAIRRSQVKGHAKVFLVPEHAKKRFRPIMHTFDVNDAFGKATLRKLKMTGKNDITTFPFKGECCAAFDFKAYFHQFQYGEGVGDLFCFRSNGKFYALNKLAMGQRHAVEIAQSVTDVLLDFPERRCKTVGSVIDNVIFVGSREEVRHDIVIFLERCKLIGAMLNEQEEIEANGIDSCIKTKLEWCGVSLDFANSAVALTEKSLEKTRLSWSNREYWTWRNAAAHIGLMFWSWGILDIPVHEYYVLLRFISHAGQILQADENLWDQRAPIPPSVMKVMEKWTSLIFANAPRTVSPSSDTAWYICTDASRFGWGYVALHKSGEIRTHGERWSTEQLQDIYARGGFQKMSKSVYSEPLAVYFSLCHLLKNNNNMDLHFAPEISENLRYKIQLATDNVSTKYTLQRGFASRSYDLNVAVRNIRNAFPQSKFDIDFHYVPGKQNVSDPYSRKDFQTNRHMYGFEYEKLRRQMGSIFPDLKDINFTGPRNAGILGGLWNPSNQ